MLPRSDAIPGAGGEVLFLILSLSSPNAVGKVLSRIHFYRFTLYAYLTHASTYHFKHYAITMHKSPLEVRH